MKWRISGISGNSDYSENSDYSDHYHRKTITMKPLILTLLTLFCAQVLCAQVPYVFKGKLNGKIAVEIAFEEMSARDVGYIYYPNAKNPAPILIAGTNKNRTIGDNDNHYFVTANEYQADGAITGKLNLHITEVESCVTFIDGKWTNPTTGKSMALTNVEVLYDLPAWYPGTPKALTAPERKDYSFNYSFTKDGEWLQTISLETVALDRQLPEMCFTFDLRGAFNKQQETGLTWIDECDVNFDGIADLMVYVGLAGHGQTQSCYKAFVWNDATRQFYPVEAFDAIVEPDFNAKTKTITSFDRDSGYGYETSYRWKNGRLVQVGVQKTKLFDD